MWLAVTTVPTARGQNPDPQPKTAQPLESKTASAPWVTPAVRANRVERRTFESAAAKTKVSYHIYAPEVYDQEKDSRFPVLYWLHGSSGGLPGIKPLSEFFDDAIRKKKIPPMLVVFPNGLELSMWCDSKDSRVPMETVVVKELVPHVDKIFRTVADRGGRIIEGFSMGGYGAARLGFRYPDLFAAVSMDAAGTLDLDFSGPQAQMNPDERAFILSTVYGNDMAYYRLCSPITITNLNAGLLRGTQRVRQVVGDQDFVLANNVAFHGHLNGLGIGHEFRTVAGVEHNCAKLQLGLGETYWAFYRDALR